MPDIVISEFMDQAAVDSAAKDFDVLYDAELVDRPEDLKAQLAEARGLVVRNRTRVTKELLDAAPKLKVVGRLGVGLDNIDLKACEERGVKVCPATGANDLSVAEWAIASCLILFRGAFMFGPQMLAGEWPRSKAMGRETAGKKLGLVGYGNIAKVTAGLARALGMEVAAFDPYVPADDPAWQGVERFEGLESLLSACDAVSLHVPLNASTRNLIDAAAIAKMKKGAILLNAARGGVVDEVAMAEALKSGALAGAAMDVYVNEPLKAEAAQMFQGVPNLLMTPHIGGVTVESNIRVSALTIENVIRELGA